METSAVRFLVARSLTCQCRSRTSLSIRGLPPARTGVPSPIHGEAHSMPMRNSIGLDDGYGVKNARTATIEPNEQGAVGPTQMQSAWCTLLQDIELMPQYQDFGFQPRPRLEAVAQDADEKEGSCNHATIML